MQQLLSKTLSEIVTEKHQTAVIFEKYNLDFCCKGRRSLKEACDDNNIPLQDVITELELIYGNGKDEVDLGSIKLSDLIDVIVNKHHSYVKTEMPRILFYLEKVSSKHGKAHNELYKISSMFVELVNEMTHHLENEETNIFPRIKMLEQKRFGNIPVGIKDFEYLQLPIIDLENEHENAGLTMAEIRKLTNDFTPPANACTSFILLYTSLKEFELDLHKHVHLENGVLFPRALLLEKDVRLNTLN